MSRFESSAVDIRNFSAPVDGVREIRCPKKLDGVIAAQRCLEAQKEGCACERMATSVVRLAIAKAKTGSDTPRHKVSTEERTARDARIRQMAEDGVSVPLISIREKLSYSRIKAVIAGGEQ